MNAFGKYYIIKYRLKNFFFQKNDGPLPLLPVCGHVRQYQYYLICSLASLIWDMYSGSIGIY